MTAEFTNEASRKLVSLTKIFYKILLVAHCLYYKELDGKFKESGFPSTSASFTNC